jgi:hypothetical protein
VIDRVRESVRAAFGDLTRRDAFWIALPLVVITLYTSPLIGYMLPGFQSFLGENYQPLRALKFYASLGGDFHKYGPMVNFMLLPFYGPTFLYWWATGSFEGPSGDFPYGLTDPLGQLTFLIMGGRIFFLAIGLALYAGLMIALRRVGFDVRIVALAFLMLVATDQPVAYHLANDRPDGPAYEFLAAALAVYVLMLYQGITLVRGVLLSLFAVFSISSKEMAGPTYVLPYLGLGWLIVLAVRERPERKAELVRVAVVSLATGVGSYLLLNVVYAPKVWLLRMSHWLGGAGTSKDVWIEGGDEIVTSGTRLETILEGMLGAIGPGGCLVALVALAALAIRRPRFAGMISLPLLSLTLLGFWPLAFPGDRFYAFGGIALVPPVVLGLTEIGHGLERSRLARVVAFAMLAGALAVNALYANWTWLVLDFLPEHVTERALLAESPRFEGRINILAVHPAVPGKSRLEVMGFDVDPRSIAQIVAAPPSERPDRIYTNSGGLAFVEHAAQSEARAELLREQGFEIRDWNGLEGLGYRRIAVVETALPRWFPFGWMESVQWRVVRSPILVYERIAPAGEPGMQGAGGGPSA